MSITDPDALVPETYEVDRAIRGHEAGNRGVETLNDPAALDPALWPEAWKAYERKAFPRFSGQTLSAALPPTRRSTRSFNSATVSLSMLSALLEPLSIHEQESRSTRAVPSAGALYPIETYIMLLSAGEHSGMSCYYDDQRHAIVPLFPLPTTMRERPEDFLGVTPTPNAALYVLFTAVLYRTMRKYGARGYRYALLEAGAMASAIDEAARRLGLGTVWLGGFDDSRASELIGIRAELELEVPLLFLAVGAP